MYDPTIGRWTSEDPLGFEAGDKNLFRYVKNQPTTRTDPSGLSEIGPNFTDRPVSEQQAILDERVRRSAPLSDFEIGHVFRAYHDAVVFDIVGGPVLQPGEVIRLVIRDIRSRALEIKARELAAYGEVYAASSVLSALDLPSVIGAGSVLCSLEAGVQAEIAGFIRDLSVPMYRVREVARAQLRRLAPLSLPQLAREYLRGQAESPERHRRIQLLLPTLLPPDWIDDITVRELNRLINLTEPGLARRIGDHVRRQLISAEALGVPGEWAEADYPADLWPILRSCSKSRLIHNK